MGQQFVTAGAARARVGELLAAVDAAYAEMRALCLDEVGTGFRLELAERLETQCRINRGLMYRVFAQLADPPDEPAMVPAVRDRLWARLRITPGEVKRRLRVAALLRPRRRLSGPPLPPVLARVAGAVESGLLGEEHLRVITTVMAALPSAVSVTDREAVEASLIAEAARSDAGIVRQAGRRIEEIFNPDGHYDDQDRARRRGIHLGDQQRDGMSAISGWIDPQLRAYLEAVTAAVRPGRHLPHTTTDTTGTTGTTETTGTAGTAATAAADTAATAADTAADGVGDIDTGGVDLRSAAQRRHDGLTLGLKIAVASGRLGSHRGHPVTVIVRTTLGELNQAAHAVADPRVSMPGPARTGGTGVLPMRELIRMAADAIHYLAVFDDHTERPLYLGRQKRIATADQRLICYARDGGCTAPGCGEPGYHAETHHQPAWEDGGLTDADHLFFACGPHHSGLTEGRWQATITPTGRLAWTNDHHPPTVNHAHHPEELLRAHTDPPEDPG